MHDTGISPCPRVVVASHANDYANMYEWINTIMHRLACIPSTARAIILCINVRTCSLLYLFMSELIPLLGYVLYILYSLLYCTLYSVLYCTMYYCIL